MVLQLNLYAPIAKAPLLAGPLERWAEGFGSGAVKGALIGAGVAIILAIIKASNSWGGSAATQARLAARGQLPMGAAPRAASDSGGGISLWRIVRGLLLLCGAALCGLLGLYYLIAGAQVQSLADVAQATPQPLTASQLLEKGPGKNLHIELQKFTFGPPTIEKDDNGQWEWVWMVLTPESPAKGKYNTIVLRSGRVKDQAALDELRKQSTLDVLVTSSLSEGMPLTVKPSDTFRKAQAKVDSSKTAYLNDHLKLVNLFGRDLVDADMFDTSWCTWLFAIGGVLCVAGFVLFFLIFTGKKKPAVE
jgi:hypothetical protein